MGSTGIVHAPPPKSISSQRRAIGRSTPTGGISTSGSAFTNEVTETWHAETLFEETLLPVCSPAFLEARGRPREPADLHGWPLLYDLHWTTDWSHWFAHHGARAADLSPASGFRLYSMMVQAAVKGMGVALGHSLMITRELEQGTLVSLFDSRVTAPARYLLVTAPASMGKPEVRAFRQWILGQAGHRSRGGELLALVAIASFQLLTMGMSCIGAVAFVA